MNQQCVYVCVHRDPRLSIRLDVWKQLPLAGPPLRVCARDQSSPGTRATEPPVSACSLPCVLKHLINPTLPLTATCEDRPLTPLQTLLQSCFSHTVRASDTKVLLFVMLLVRLLASVVHFTWCHETVHCKLQVFYSFRILKLFQWFQDW